MISRMLLDKGGARMVESEQELTEELETILVNSQVQQYMGSQSYEVFSRNCGAVKRVIKNLESLHIV